MLKGTIYITCDIEMVKNSIYNNCKVVAITENAESINTPDLTNVSIASILLPPYQAVMAEMDGDMGTFYNLYGQHLATKEADSYICLIIAALVRGINILIYIPKDEFGLTFTSAFMQYLQMVYGITVGTENIPCNYNPEFNAVLCNRLYIHEFIIYEEFMVAYPANVSISVEVIPQLMFDMEGYYPPLHNEQEAVIFFNNYKNRIKQNNNKFLIRPIIKGGNRQC